MNCRRETVEKDVPRAAQALAPRAGQPQGIGPEVYLNSTSQGEPVLSLSKEHPRTPGRTDISAVAVTPGRDEISGRSRSVEVGKIF
jgi:hypothetical protein